MRIRMAKGIVAVLAAVAAVGCGGSGGGKDVEAFLGTYNVDSNAVVVAEGQTVPISASNKNIVISRGNGADLTINLGPVFSGCSLSANVSGPGTFSVSATTCSTSNDCGGKMTVNVPAGSGSVANKKFAWGANGSVNANCSDGSSLTGTYTWQIAGSKV